MSHRQGDPPELNAHRVTETPDRHRGANPHVGSSATLHRDLQADVDRAHPDRRRDGQDALRGRRAQARAGGKVTLWANDKQIGEGRLDKTVSLIFTTYAGMDMGRDNGGVVDLAYEDKAPYRSRAR